MVETQSGVSFEEALQARQIFQIGKEDKLGYSEYTATFPKADGTISTIAFRDNVPSPYMTYTEGIVHIGTFMPKDIQTGTLASISISDTLAKSLQFVYAEEGCFDAVNTYDKGIFSYGFIQFSGGMGGSLNDFMLLLKIKHPETFAERFGKYGINVEEATPRAVVSVLDTEDNQELTGDAAWMYMMNNKQLTSVFIAAGSDMNVVSTQIEYIMYAYMNPAINSLIELEIGGTLHQGIPLHSIINSEMGVIAMVDLTIVMWVHKMNTLFRQAIEEVATEFGLTTLEDVKNIDERAVIQKIISYEDTKALTDRRLNKVLSSGMSFEKNTL
jgi:peptidoglycan endopeptidase LytF